jgi:hypothetical protein
MEISDRKSRKMRQKRQENGARPKTRSEAGATPSCRKSAARSLRASGVTPASCCWNAQLVFWPRRTKGIRNPVRQDVRQNRKRGTRRRHGNH